MSGDPKYRIKKAVEQLDAVAEVQAQRWLQLGGRTAEPPDDAIELLQCAKDEALTVGVSDDSDCMRRAEALLKALASGPSIAPIPGTPAASPPPPRTRYALPGDFDGTRQGVARALRADRYRASLSDRVRDPVTDATPLPPPSRSLELMEELDSAVRQLQGQPADAALDMLNGIIKQAVEAGVRADAPSMKRAVALCAVLLARDDERRDEGQAELEPADASSDGVEATPLDLEAKLDVLFTGYADPEL